MRKITAFLFSVVTVAAAQPGPAPSALTVRCGDSGQNTVAATSTATPGSCNGAVSQEHAAIRFEDATAKSGIHFTHSFGSARLGSLLEGTGAGCVWFDYNNSGRPSLYVVNGRPLEDAMHPYPLKVKPSTPPHNHLYRNDGNGRFTDVTEESGLNPEMYSIAATAGDYDNDGMEDLLVTGYGKVALYHNDGQGHFQDVTAKAGIKVEGWSISSTWLDYDRDGCLDLLVGRYVKFDPKYRTYYAADNYPGPLAYAEQTNVLFHNNCDGTFTDVTTKSGMGSVPGRTMGVIAADFDNDGWDDLYVANDSTQNFLFRNKHDGTFEEIGNESGSAYGQDGEATSSMGAVAADFWNRGVLDLWVTDGSFNRFLKNLGAPPLGTSSSGSQSEWKGFEDVTAEAGISQTDAQYVSWGSGVYDFDNDGQLDMLVFHGGLIQLIPQEHTLFRGVGQGKFEDDSRKAGAVLDARTVARGACFADYANNGKVGAFLVNLGAEAKLIENVSTGTGHWIDIQLIGAMRDGDRGTPPGPNAWSNRDGVGARVEIVSGSRRWTQERVASSGYLSENDGRLHFGLGTANVIDKVTVRWPSSRVQTLEHVSVDRVVIVEEPR